MAKKDKAREKARKAAREAAKRQSKRSRSRGSGTVTIPDGVDFYHPPEDATETIAIVGFEAGEKLALLTQALLDEPRVVRPCDTATRPIWQCRR